MKKECVVVAKELTEWGGTIYRCSNCLQEKIWLEFNYCPICGSEIIKKLKGNEE